MTRRAVIGVALSLGLTGCLHFEDRPLQPETTLDTLELRSLADPDLLAFVERNGGVLPGSNAEWDFPSLLLAAYFYNPNLDTARAAWARTRAAILTAGERPNPSVTFAPGYDTTTPTSLITPWILTLTFDIPIETAGKRGFRIAEATELSEAARFAVATAAWQVRSTVRRTMLDLYAAIETEALQRRRSTIQDTNVMLMERQLAAGLISPFELTQARLLLNTIRLALQDAIRQEAEARVQLAGALGIGVAALEHIRLDFEGFEQPTAELPPTEVRRLALLNRPDILTALSEYDSRQAALQLQIARQYPDIHLGPGYQMDQSDNKWTIGFGAVLPILSQNRGPIAEAEARRSEAAAHFVAVQQLAMEQIDQALAAYRTSRNKLATANGIVKDLQRQTHDTQQRYDAGEISRLELGTIRLELSTSELARLDALIGAQRALGQLEDAIQRPANLPEGIADAPSR